MDSITLELFRYDDSRASDWSHPWTAAGSSGTDEPPRGDVRCLLAYRGGRPVARLALGARQGFSGAPGSTGYVGWYEAADEEAGAAALRRAVRELYAAGAERVVGPLNGSTWSRYRLVLPPDGEAKGGAPFLGEPQNPASYLRHFAAAGFVPHLEYETRLVADPRGDPEVETELQPRLRERGISIRPIDLAAFERELRDVFDLSLDSFRSNPYYTPIGFDEFAGMYQRMRPLLVPELVRLARDEAGRLVGYVFAYPDPLAPAERPRVVLKTLAAAPEARSFGLGRTLVDDINRVAARSGSQVLHALMQVTNASRKISNRSESELFRRYTLFQAAAP